MNKRLFVFWGVLAAVVVATTGGYFVWTKYFKYDLEKVYQEEEQKYIAAMTSDTYGGKTPQETLDMFVDALRKEDIELASKYFMLDENLSREWVLERLSDIENRNLLAQMIGDITARAKPDLVNRLDDNDFKFVLYDDGGTVGARIEMQLNKYSQVWKIESL